MEQKKIPPDHPRIARDLGSWKEIAHYLDVNVRTAQKWEEERGLPVRRAPGVRGRVSIDTVTLDVWRQRLPRSASPGDSTYRWPLGRGVTVDLRFLGPDPRPEEIELLRDYLNVFKATLA